MKNLFDGDSYRAIFARAIYKHIVSRKWYCFATVMQDVVGRQLTCNVSDCDHYGELKKAQMDLRKAIGTGLFETRGNNRDKEFRYIGPDDDPLADMRKARAINDIRRYYEFCQDSAGFFPTAWLDYFLGDSIDLLDIKKRRRGGEQIISTSADRQLKNIALLPLLYEAIRQQRVLSIAYKPYAEAQMQLIFHPHFMKEYNGRWHVLGHAEGHEPAEGFNLAIDRIVGRPEITTEVQYRAAPKGFYAHYFDDTVGVTHTEGQAEDIRVRAYGAYMFNLTDTKPIHRSQRVIVPFGRHDDGTYGEFALHVEVNNELIGRILMMGSELEVVAPADVRQIFRQKTAALAARYATAATDSAPENGSKN